MSSKGQDYIDNYYEKHISNKVRLLFRSFLTEMLKQGDTYSNPNIYKMSNFQPSVTVATSHSQRINNNMTNQMQDQQEFKDYQHDSQQRQISE